MSVTPLTTESRAVAERMRVFPNMEGNVTYLRKLIYEDSATLQQLIAEAEAVDPPLDAEVIQHLYRAASFAGNAGEAGGNVMLWPLMQHGADAVIVACDAIEAANEEPPEAESTKRHKRSHS